MNSTGREEKKQGREEGEFEWILFISPSPTKTSNNPTVMKITFTQPFVSAFLNFGGFSAISFVMIVIPKSFLKTPPQTFLKSKLKKEK